MATAAPMSRSGAEPALTQAPRGHLAVLHVELTAPDASAQLRYSSQSSSALANRSLSSVSSPRASFICST